MDQAIAEALQAVAEALDESNAPALTQSTHQVQERQA